MSGDDRHRLPPRKMRILRTLREPDPTVTRAAKLREG